MAKTDKTYELSALENSIPILFEVKLADGQYLGHINDNGDGKWRSASIFGKKDDGSTSIAVSDDNNSKEEAAARILQDYIGFMLTSIGYAVAAIHDLSRPK